MNTIEKSSIESIDIVLTNTLASKLHEEWKATFKEENPKDETRIKTTTDGEWIARNQESDQVDILNTPFEGLPKDWQEENLEAAEAVLSIVRNVENGIDLKLKTLEIPQYKIELMASQVHEAWLERQREKSGGGDLPDYITSKNLHLSYEKLPDTEKKKDRKHVILAIELIRTSINKGLVD